MRRRASIAVAVGLGAAFAASSALAQTHMTISGARQSSGSTQRTGRFVVPQGRRPLIGLAGSSLQDGTRRRSGGRDRFFYGGYFPREYDAYGPEQYDAYGPEPTTPAPQAAAAPPPKQEPVPNGVMLELQGNRWVRVDSFTTVAAASPGASSAAMSGPVVSSSPAKELAGKESAAKLAVKEIPASVLVYRDGHTEELRSYSIIGTTMYAKADYWSTGAWTRKIPIADLDLPATVQKNHERGLGFQLPSGPDEVILRP